MTRTNADGSAYKGSQRQLQDYVNDTPSELNQQIFGAIESLPRSAGLRWVSPLRGEKLSEKGYQEYSDAEFLSAVRQTALSFELRRFWPSGGPTWDALATVYTGGPSGVLLVEAKAHPAEMQSACGATDKASIRQITAALDATKSWLKVPVSVDWFSQYYQAANRLAHLYFLREIARVSAWLANVYFVDDASHKATTRLEWDKGIDEAEKCLGLSGVSVPYAGKVFLSAKKVAAPDELCI